MYAHYFADKARKFIIISISPRPVGEEIEVSGKAEARKIAAKFGARLWNF